MKAPRCSMIALALAALCLSLPAHETEEKIPDPGFRPESALAAVFVAEINASTIRVYPSIIRSPATTTYSAESQQQIVAFLNGKQITKAISDAKKIDPGELQGRGQFDWFQNDMKAIGREVTARGINEDYILVMEVLFPPPRGTMQSVFGIHCIVLDEEGQNVFSFLLNSHHQMFIDAAMHIEEGTAETRASLISQATAVGLEALVAQLQNATMKK